MLVSIALGALYLIVNLRALINVIVTIHGQYFGLWIIILGSILTKRVVP